MTGPNGPQNQPPGGYQQGPQGGYQQGGYQQGPQGSYQPGFPQQGYPQQGQQPWGAPPPNRKNGAIIGIVSAIAVALAVALVLVLVLDKDDAPQNAGGEGGQSQGAPASDPGRPEGAPSVPIPPPNQTGELPTGSQPGNQQPSTDGPGVPETNEQPGVPGGSGPDDKTAVLGQVDKFFAAANAGDWDTVAGLTCSDDTEDKVNRMKQNFEQVGGHLDYQAGDITIDDAEHGTVAIQLSFAGETEDITVAMVKEGEWKYCGA